MTDKSLISVSLRSVSEDCLVLLFGTYALVSFFSITLRVGFCALDKTTTSTGLDRLTSHRR